MLRETAVCLSTLSLVCSVTLENFLVFLDFVFSYVKGQESSRPGCENSGAGACSAFGRERCPAHPPPTAAVAVVGAVGGGGQGLSRWDHALKRERSEQSDGAEYVTCSRSIERECAVTAGKSSFAHQRVLERGQSGLSISDVS